MKIIDISKTKLFSGGENTVSPAMAAFPSQSNGLPFGYFPAGQGFPTDSFHPDPTI